jgi:hypothetical protein
MGLGKPELYGFEFGESKIRPRPAPLPSLEILEKYIQSLESRN